MNEFTRYNDNGTVNFDESVEAYGKALEFWATDRIVEQTEIQEAVDSVLVLAGESRVSMSKLANMVLVKLQPTLAEYDEKQKAIEEFIKHNTVSEKNPNGRYSAQKGKGGGYSFTKCK